jgi:hypothetical protein
MSSRSERKVTPQEFLGSHPLPVAIVMKLAEVTLDAKEVIDDNRDHIASQRLGPSSADAATRVADASSCRPPVLANKSKLSQSSALFMPWQPSMRSSPSARLGGCWRGSEHLLEPQLSLGWTFDLPETPASTWIQLAGHGLTDSINDRPPFVLAPSARKFGLTLQPTKFVAFARFGQRPADERGKIARTNVAHGFEDSEIVQLRILYCLSRSCFRQLEPEIGNGSRHNFALRVKHFDVQRNTYCGLA